VPPRKFLRDSLGFAVAQYVIRVLLLFRAVVVARLLGPLPPAFLLRRDGALALDRRPGRP